MGQLVMLDAQQLLECLNQCDIHRRPQRLALMIKVLSCYGQVSDFTLNYLFLENVVQAAKSVNVQDIIAQGYQGADIKTQLQHAQLAQISTLLNR